MATTPATLIAQEARYTFAYPANGGEFPTRATAMDLVQSVYDRLGVLANQGPSDAWISSPDPAAPGLNDLSTQAPKVNFYGVQVSGELAAANQVVKNVRVHPATTPLTVDAVTVGIPTNVGPTAGYHATQVRAWDLNILIVRWHDVGTQTIGAAADSQAGTAPTAQAALASAPGTFYYDVPAGKYSISNSRVDSYGPL